MKNIKVPLACGAIFLISYSTLFIYAAYSRFAQILFILAPFIVSWIVYRLLNNLSSEPKNDEVLTNK